MQYTVHNNQAQYTARNYKCSTQQLGAVQSTQKNSVIYSTPQVDAIHKKQVRCSTQNNKCSTPQDAVKTNQLRYAVQTNLCSSQKQYIVHNRMQFTKVVHSTPQNAVYSAQLLDAIRKQYDVFSIPKQLNAVRSPKNTVHKQYRMQLTVLHNEHNQMRQIVHNNYIQSSVHGKQF